MYKFLFKEDSNFQNKVQNSENTVCVFKIFFSRTSAPEMPKFIAEFVCLVKILHSSDMAYGRLVCYILLQTKVNAFRIQCTLNDLHI